MSDILIYISHIYQNKEENKLEVERIIRELKKDMPEHTYLSPIDALGFLYDDIPYDEGLRDCKKLLSICDAMWVYGDYTGSKGVEAEMRYAKEHAIPYEIR